MGDFTKSEWTAHTWSQGYIIQLAEGGPWLKNDLTWTPVWEERGVWHELTDAELAIARSLSPARKCPTTLIPTA